VAYDDFVAAGSLGAAREKGLVSFSFHFPPNKLGCLFIFIYINITWLLLISLNVI